MHEYLLPGVYIEEPAIGPPPITGVPTSIAAFIGAFDSGPTDRAMRISSLAELNDTFAPVDYESETSCAIRQFFANGGRECWVVRVGEAGGMPSVAAIAGERAQKSGLYAFDNVDIFNLLCIPSLSDAGLSESIEIIDRALAYCEERRAFLLVDPPRVLETPNELANWLENNPSLRNPNAGLYFPAVTIPDPLDGSSRRVGASGTIAGVIARTDAARGVWKAPAGTEATLRSVSGLDYLLTQQEAELLLKSGVNCLRVVGTGDPVCWGARTLIAPQDPQWRYVPTRRLVLFLEESISRGLRWAILELNEKGLWLLIRRSVEAFLHEQFKRGALQGLKPEEAFFVQCDEDLMTQDDIDNGVCILSVGFALSRPAEFVVVSITIKTHVK